MNSYIEKWDNIFCERHVTNLVKTIYPKLIKYYSNEAIYLIDIGANVGKVYDLLSKLISIEKCYMFEANSELYKYLINKYKNNSVINIYNNAIGITEDILYFDESSIEHQINNNSNNLNFGLCKVTNTPTNKKIQSIKISQFFQDNPTLYAKSCFIKIDTENFDYQILSDLVDVVDLFNKKPIIEFENNYFCDGHSLVWAQSIVDKYIDKGYERLKITRNLPDGILQPM
jgi:FkbM family methyltransferase